jgi:hypothetical protein
LASSAANCTDIKPDAMIIASPATLTDNFMDFPSERRG